VVVEVILLQQITSPCRSATNYRCIPRSRFELKITFQAPARLRISSTRIYSGIGSAAVGDRDRAAEFLDLDQKAGLLPEKNALL
jgi:hypothetical protein